MTDIETLSSNPDAAIIAIGSCVFEDGEIFETQEILIDPILSPGTRSQSTYKWWQEQETEVYERMLSGTTEPWQACIELDAFLSGVTEMWANPPQFDIVILRHLFTQYGLKFPVHHRNELDFRTVRMYAKKRGINYNAPYKKRTAHDALSDAIAQAKALMLIERALGL